MFELVCELTLLFILIWNVSRTSNSPSFFLVSEASALIMINMKNN